MDEQTANRIATALEQIALELAEGNALHGPGAELKALAQVEQQKPVYSAPNGGFTGYAPAPSQPHAAWSGNASLGVPQLVPPQCPDHGKPWRNGQRGAYCATRVGDGWCQRHPQVVGVGVLP